MAHRLASEAEADLAHIGNYIAKQSGNPEIARRQIDFITTRFLLLSRHPELGRKRDEDLRLGLRASPLGST